MTNLFFYFPLTYRWHTRERKRFLIPFLLTDFLPVFVLGLSFGKTINIHYIIMIFLSFFAMFSIYEIGYIINDAITIRIEKDPVLRLTQNELDYFERKGLFIFGVRFSFLLLFCISLFLLTNDTMTCFLLCNIALLTTYFFHNYYRNNIRFITNTILNIGKYFIPLISIDFVFPLLSSIAYFVFFPFFRSLTYVLEKKTTANVNVFQIIFVLLFLAFLILLYSFIKLSFYEYSFYGLFSAYKIAVCLLQMKRK